MFLRQIALKEIPEALQGSYPFSVPAVRGVATLSFESSVTILVGENGVGKSTLLEALGVATQAIAVGELSLERDPTLVPARQLAKYLKLVWNQKTRKGFFLRSEDFFNFAKRVREDQKDLQDMADEYERTLTGYGRQLAMGTVISQKRALAAQYGEDLNAFSHGESFLQLFNSRMSGPGLYILDEPEAPLSPMRQLGFLGMVLDAVRAGAQFVIATHSPILMALPGAKIFNLSAEGFVETSFAELEHVQLTRRFLNSPESFLRHL